MKKLVLAFVIGTIVVASVAAQQPSPQPVEFVLKVDSKTIETIGKGLGMLAYNEAAPVMQILQAQINAQIQAAAKPKEEEKK